MNLMLFYPQIALDSDVFRGALEGYSGLLDRRILARLRETNLPVSELQELGYARLDAFRRAWESLPEAARRGGSISNGLAHAQTRLNGIYRRYFAEQRVSVSNDRASLPRLGQ